MPYEVLEWSKSCVQQVINLFLSLSVAGIIFLLCVCMASSITEVTRSFVATASVLLLLLFPLRFIFLQLDLFHSGAVTNCFCCKLLGTSSTLIISIIFPPSSVPFCCRVDMNLSLFLRILMHYMQVCILYGSCT